MHVWLQHINVYITNGNFLLYPVLGLTKQTVTTQKVATQTVAKQTVAHTFTRQGRTTYDTRGKKLPFSTPVSYAFLLPYQE